jgi:hypothetical protein
VAHPIVASDRLFVNYKCSLFSFIPSAAAGRPTAACPFLPHLVD